MEHASFLRFLRRTLGPVKDGVITSTEFACLVFMILAAHPATGIWRGCSGFLSVLLGGSVSARAARHALERLEGNGFIKRFIPSPGQRGNYPILIHGYEPTEGARRGMRLNALATTDWQKPVYEDVTDRQTPASTLPDIPLTTPRGL